MDQRMEGFDHEMEQNPLEWKSHIREKVGGALPFEDSGMEGTDLCDTDPQYKKSYDHAHDVLGKDRFWARAYASACLLGRSPEWAVRFADLSQENDWEWDRTEKYLDVLDAVSPIAPSSIWADAYACRMALFGTRSFQNPEALDSIHEEGCTYADAYEREIVEGKSKEFAATYAWEVVLGKSDLWAEGYTIKGEGSPESDEAHVIPTEDEESRQRFADAYAHFRNEGEEKKQAIQDADILIHRQKGSKKEI